MREENKARKYALLGLPFQMLLIGAFIYRTQIDQTNETPLILSLIGELGAFLFLFCLISIYLKISRTNKLLTGGVFKYTRHPMYTGVFLMDLKKWFALPLSFETVIAGIMLYIGLFVAGYFQEKETLARFGEEAESYYAKTPRIFLLYPFCRQEK